MAGTESASVREDELYTLEQLKWRLGLTDSAFRALRDAGLPEITRGKRKYFLGKRVMEWFAADDPSVRDTAAQALDELPLAVEDRAEVAGANIGNRKRKRSTPGSVSA